MADDNNDREYATALDEAERMLGFRLERFLGTEPTEPANAADFKRIATIHAFGDAWPRTEHLDTTTRALNPWPSPRPSAYSSRCEAKSALR